MEAFLAIAAILAIVVVAYLMLSRFSPTTMSVNKDMQRQPRNEPSVPGTMSGGPFDGGGTA